MKEKLQGILQTAKEQLAAAKDSRALDEARVKFLGKKGELTALLKGMKDVAAEERPVVGQLINDVRAEIETIIDKQKKLIEQAALEKKLEAETIDVTFAKHQLCPIYIAIPTISSHPTKSNFPLQYYFFSTPISLKYRFFLHRFINTSIFSRDFSNRLHRRCASVPGRIPPLW